MIPAALGLMAVSLTAVVGYFSVIGIGQFTASVAIPAMFLAALIEVIKIALAAWLHHNWRMLPLGIKSGGLAFITIAMIITALGVHNYLMTAHNTDDIKRTQTKGEIAVLAAGLDADTKQRDFIQGQLAQLSKEYERYAELGSVTKSRAARLSDKETRAELTEELREVQARIATANAETARLSVAVSHMEASLGPAMALRKILGISEDSAVNLYTLLFLLVGDPLAVFLSVAAVWQLGQGRATEAGAGAEKGSTLPAAPKLRTMFDRLTGTPVSEFDRIAINLEKEKAARRSARPDRGRAVAA